MLMRFACIVMILVSTARADSFELRPPELTLRAGLHHTSVTKDDGSPVGFGPRVELETTWQPIPWVSAGVVGSYSSYSSSNLRDGVTGSIYDVSLKEVGLGARLYIHPHWRVFIGGTVWKLWEHEYQTISHGVDSYDNQTSELVVGGYLARVDNNLISVAATHSSYTQFGAESVEVWSVTLGVTHCWTHCW
jgi:hypothetical protein